MAPFGAVGLHRRLLQCSSLRILSLCHVAVGWAAGKSLLLHGVVSAREVMHAVLMQQQRVREDRGSIV